MAGQNVGWSKIIGTCPKTDIRLQLTFAGQDGLGSCRCCLPGICNRRRIVVLKKEEVFRNDPGRFLRAGRRKACQKLALFHDETAP